jgi:nucleoside-diphosphate-sugar epimerase
MSKPPRVVVTGGAGFIGSHLVQRLFAQGASVLVLDSMEYGQNLPPVDAEIEVVTFKLGADSPARSAQLRALLHGADYVYHLAAEKRRVGVPDQDQDKDRFSTNVVGTESLLKAAVLEKVKKIVFTSSLYVYGRMSGPLMHETELPAPTTPYGISKLQCEHLCHRMSVRSRIPIICLRPFFVYGPHQSSTYPSVIIKNFDRMLRGLAPIVRGDGEQTFDYTYVGDVVSALLAAMQHGKKFGVFNIGSGTPQTINALIHEMTDIAGHPPIYLSEPADWTAGSYRVPDVTKWETSFGYLPHTPLREGLQRTYDWMRNQPKAQEYPCA